MKLKHGIVLFFCLVLTSKVNAVNLFAQEKKTAPLPEIHRVKDSNKNQPDLISEKKVAPLPEICVVKDSNKNSTELIVEKKAAILPEIHLIKDSNKNSPEVVDERKAASAPKTTKEPAALKIQDKSTKKEFAAPKNIQTEKNQANTNANIINNYKTPLNSVKQNTTEKPINVLIKKIDVEGYQIPTDKDILAVTSKYEGKYLTIEEIKKIPEEINDIYKNYKILTALAYLPPQDISENIIKIKVLEGRIGKIQVVGNKTTNESYIKNLLKQKEGDIIFVPEIEHEIINFNKNNDVKLSASIKKGEGFGTTDIVLNLKEPNPNHLSLNFNNSGTETTGLYKTGINMQNDSLLGFRDRLIAGYELSKGIDSVYTGYDVPIGYSGLRLGGLISKGNSSVIQGDYKEFDIKAKSTNYSVYLSKPVYNSRKFYIGSNASLNFKKSTTDMLGFHIEDLGGDPTPRITTTKISLTSILNDKYGQWGHNSDFNFGINALGGAEKFFKYTGNIQRITFLGKNCSLILRGSTQLAERKLPSLEKFQIGGIDTVRGYPESYSVADYGYVFNSELRYPLVFLPQKIGKYQLRNRFQGAIFMDMGRSYYKDKSFGDPTKLLGIGSGIRFRISKNLSGSVDYSYGLTHRNDSINPSRVNFQIISN